MSEIAAAAARLRNDEEAEQRAQANEQAFLNQMTWNATLDALESQYGITATMVRPCGPARYTSQGLHEGRISILGLKCDLRVNLKETKDQAYVLGYRLERQVLLTRVRPFGRSKSVSRAQIADHLEKVARRTARG